MLVEQRLTRLKMLDSVATECNNTDVVALNNTPNFRFTSKNSTPSKKVAFGKLVECFSIPSRKSPIRSITPLAHNSPHNIYSKLNASPLSRCIKKSINPFEESTIKRIKKEKEMLLSDLDILKRGELLNMHICGYIISIFYF